MKQLLASQGGLHCGVTFTHVKDTSVNNIYTETEFHLLFFLLHAGSVKVWDPRQKGKPVATMEPAEGDARRDCWTVAFGNILIKL